MKCACGYEYHRIFGEPTGDETNKGNQDFIAVGVTLTIPRDYDPDRPVQVYACPKCGTLKINELY